MQLKTISDYYEKLFEEYPEVSQSDIKKICQYGWKALLLHNKYGGDTLVKNNKFWFYCGKLMNNSFRYFDYYKTKIAIKLRVMYKRKRIKWDGYYYFARTKSQYEDYLSQIKKTGRPKKIFKFENVYCYKIFDECNILNTNAVAIFRLKQPIQHGFSLYFKELKTQNAELVLEREPYKFNDILLQNYNYKFLNLVK